MYLDSRWGDSNLILSVMVESSINVASLSHFNHIVWAAQNKKYFLTDPPFKIKQIRKSNI